MADKLDEDFDLGNDISSEIVTHEALPIYLRLAEGGFSELNSDSSGDEDGDE